MLLLRGGIGMASVGVLVEVGRLPTGGHVGSDDRAGTGPDEEIGPRNIQPELVEGLQGAGVIAHTDEPPAPENHSSFHARQPSPPGLVRLSA
jgi:hypothetical protein